MPSACVHLYAARLLAGKLNINDIPAFYLGAVAPDAVNLHEFAAESIRYSAHIRSRDYEIWKSNIKEFYNAHMADLPADFLKGFIVHLYTDIAWDEAVQPALFKHLQSKGVDESEFKSAKWAELYRLNGAIVRQSWYGDVLKALKQADCYDISTVDANMLRDYRDYLVEDYLDKIDSAEPEFLNDEMIFRTVEAVFGYLSEVI